MRFHTVLFDTIRSALRPLSGGLWTSPLTNSASAPKAWQFSRAASSMRSLLSMPITRCPLRAKSIA